MIAEATETAPTEPGCTRCLRGECVVDFFLNAEGQERWLVAGDSRSYTRETVAIAGHGDHPWQRLYTLEDAREGDLKACRARSTDVHTVLDDLDLPSQAAGSARLNGRSSASAYSSLSTRHRCARVNGRAAGMRTPVRGGRPELEGARDRGPAKRGDADCASPAIPNGRADRGNHRTIRAVARNALDRPSIATAVQLARTLRETSRFHSPTAGASDAPGLQPRR